MDAASGGAWINRIPLQIRMTKANGSTPFDIYNCVSIVKPLVINGKFPNDLDSASIFRKVIGYKLSDGYSGNFYRRCRMNFADEPVQTQTPRFMDLGFLVINALYESSGLSPPDTII